MGLSWPPDVLFQMRRPAIGVEPDASPEPTLTREEALQLVPDDISISEHWAKRDAAAATCFAAQRWAGIPLTALGHSLGGRAYVVVPLPDLPGRSRRLTFYPFPEEIFTLYPDVHHLVTRFMNVGGGKLLPLG